MSQGFVWFHNGAGEKVEAQRFYEGLLGWRPTEGPGGMTMFAREGAPFASLGAPQGGVVGWVPYARRSTRSTSPRSAPLRSAVRWCSRRRADPRGSSWWCVTLAAPRSRSGRRRRLRDDAR